MSQSTKLRPRVRRVQPTRSSIACLSLLLCGGASHPLVAEVVRIDIQTREPFAASHAFGRSGPYERLTGKLHLEVDPQAPVNEQVVDLKLAPRNERGKVELWTEFFLLRPTDLSRGNRRILYCVNNRGNKLALGAFNGQGGNDPRTLQDAGNGFLLRQGYAVLWLGWNGDVMPGNQRLQIGLPVAMLDGQPITGRIYAEISVNERSYSQPFDWGNSLPYPAVSLDNTLAVLTARPTRAEPAVEVPRQQWAFARFERGEAVPDATQLHLREGFRPGWLYELVYTGKNPRVTGLGFVAVRDAISFFRHGAAGGEAIENPLSGGGDLVYAFGISQSGRWIHHFIQQGFNGDTSGRKVFDGALAHVGGGGKGVFNSRFAQTTRHGSHHEDNLYPADFFPFTTVESEDPITGEKGDVLARARASGHVPKLFFTGTSCEYWARAASLLHTDVEGKRDMAPDPSVRVYFFTGAQHGVSASMDRGIYQHPINVVDHRPLLRALLVALDRWASTGEEPPLSRYPLIADGTLVDLETYRRSFPGIPGVAPPASFYAPLRLDPGRRWRGEGIADNVPPLVGPPYRTLVPAIDADGNELAGIRLPAISVPFATYTGWNVRAQAVGAAGMLARWSGSTLPFARDREEREARGDSRLSIRERYPSREVYLSQVARAVLALQTQGFLLDEDAIAILGKAAAEGF